MTNIDFNTMTDLEFTNLMLSGRVMTLVRDEIITAPEAKEIIDTYGDDMNLVREWIEAKEELVPMIELDMI